MKRFDSKKLTTLAMLCALAYVVMAVGRIHILLFLSYDPKDVVIAIGGFLYGPMSAFLISAVVSVVEMVTVSDTGLWGLLMNVLSTCAFVCTASFVYKKKHTAKGAALGLLLGVAVQVATMLLWNYLVTPFYMGVARQEVVALLLPAFLPFNLLKGGLNAAITLLLYKPVVNALRRAGLAPPSQASQAKGKRNTGLFLVALLVLVSCILLALVLQGKL